MKYICEKKPKKFQNKQKSNNIENFRSSYEWKCKRKYIKKRDKYLCQACFNNLFGTIRKINTENLSVHHIRPLRTNFELRLDDSNLITLCDIHHELAENGRITAETLLSILPPG